LLSDSPQSAFSGAGRRDLVTALPVSNRSWLWSQISVPELETCSVAAEGVERKRKRQTPNKEIASVVV